MFADELKIPRSRVACLIGKKGETKRRIQKATNTRLKISKEGDVFIEGEDNLDVFITCSIVKAIGRGFNPDIALTLLQDNIGLEVIDIASIIGKSKVKLKRTRARLIGTKGKAWKNLEKLTGCKMSVHGKTVAIIGDVKHLHVTRLGIEKLISGSIHGNVYRFVERAMKKQKDL